MNLVLSRVNHCKLTVDDKLINEVGFGLLVLVGVHKNDTSENAKHLAKKIATLRIFNDESGKINKSILDINGDILLVSNFTLLANTQTGTRPDFSQSGDKTHAYELYIKLKDELVANGVKCVKLGAFGEHMHLDTSLDGPYTILLNK